MDARLDAPTRAKVDDLATRFHQPRAAVLCHIMRWGLSRGDILACVQGDAEGPVRHLSLDVASALHEEIERAATEAGVKTAPWLRHMVRPVTIQDFPASWQEATPHERSHESRTYTARFMLRLDEPSQTKLQQLINQCGTSKAAIIRHLIPKRHPRIFPSVGSYRLQSAVSNRRSGVGTNRGHEGASALKGDGEPVGTPRAHLYSTGR